MPMERLLTKQEIEAELERKRAGIDARIDAIKDEVQSASDDVRRALVEKPAKVATGALAVGGAVTLFILLRRRRKRNARLERSHRVLIERYMDTLVEEVRRQRVKGKDDAEALQRAFKGRLPLIVVESDRPESKTSSITRDAISFTLNTALGFFVKVLMDKVAARMELDEQVDRFMQSIIPDDEAPEEDATAPAKASDAGTPPVEPPPPRSPAAATGSRD